MIKYSAVCYNKSSNIYKQSIITYNNEAEAWSAAWYLYCNHMYAASYTIIIIK